MGAFNAGVLGAPGPAEGSPLVQQKGSLSKLEEALSLGGILNAGESGGGAGHTHVIRGGISPGFGAAFVSSSACDLPWEEGL